MLVEDISILLLLILGAFALDMQGRVIGGVCVHGMHFMNIRGGYNGEHNNNISGLVGNIGGIISDSSSQV